jgi:hypothetical protein
MYWFAHDMAAGRTPLLSHTVEQRFAADPDLVEGLFRVLSHELPPSKLFTRRLGLAALSRALLSHRGQRMALLGEVQRLVMDEVRRGDPPPIGS